MNYVRRGIKQKSCCKDSSITQDNKFCLLTFFSNVWNLNYIFINPIEFLNKNAKLYFCCVLVTLVSTGLIEVSRYGNFTTVYHVLVIKTRN